MLPVPMSPAALHLTPYFMQEAPEDEISQNYMISLAVGLGVLRFELPKSIQVNPT